MSQDMSFAQALTEARQIIVQQSNRIKIDFEKTKALQETITAQTVTIADSDRAVREKNAELSTAGDQLKSMTASFDEARIAKEQCEAVIDRQGQRLTQMQETIAGLEKQLNELSARAEGMGQELESIRGQVPTQEDTDALAALSSLLAAKKGASLQIKPAEEVTQAMAA